MDKDDVHISYLPMAHIFERVVQVVAFCEGASVGFFQGVRFLNVMLNRL